MLRNHYKTSGTKVFVRFVSEGTPKTASFSVNLERSRILPLAKHDFHLRYSPLAVNCSADYLQTSVSLSAPTSPSAYTGPRDCTWVLRSSAGKTFAVMFQSVNVSTLKILKNNLSIPYLSQIDPDDGGGCTKNYIEVRDGPYSYSSLTGTYCGTNMPTHFLTSGSSVYVRFVVEGFPKTASFSLGMGQSKLQSTVWKSDYIS